METKLTIIVQTYNREEGLKRNLEALNNQTDQNFNLIIFNNGAKYNVEVIAGGYKNLLSKLKIIHKEENIGLVKARNESVKHVNTEFFARIDDDDFAMNDYVEKTNKLIASGYDLILVSIENSKKEDGKPGTVFSWEPWRYIIKKESFVPFPEILPEDFLSIFYYTSISKKISFDEVKIHLGDPRVFKKTHNFSRRYDIFAFYWLDKINYRNNFELGFKFHFVYWPKKLTKNILTYRDLGVFSRRHEQMSLRWSYEVASNKTERATIIKRYKILRVEITPRILDRMFWSKIYVFFRDAKNKFLRKNRTK